MGNDHRYSSLVDWGHGLYVSFFSSLVHSRKGSSDGGSVSRKTAIYKFYTGEHTTSE
jgi:hypothetical protein